MSKRLVVRQHMTVKLKTLVYPPQPFMLKNTFTMTRHFWFQFLCSYAVRRCKAENIMGCTVIDAVMTYNINTFFSSLLSDEPRPLRKTLDGETKKKKTKWRGPCACEEFINFFNTSFLFHIQLMFCCETGFSGKTLWL